MKTNEQRSVGLKPHRVRTVSDQTEAHVFLNPVRVLLLWRPIPSIRLEIHRGRSRRDVNMDIMDGNDDVLETVFGNIGSAICRNALLKVCT